MILDNRRSATIKTAGHSCDGQGVTYPLETAGTRPIVARRLDGPKRCMQTRVVGIHIIRVAHWCTILRSVVLDGPLMHPWCRQVTARLA